MVRLVVFVKWLFATLAHELALGAILSFLVTLAIHRSTIAILLHLAVKQSMLVSDLAVVV